MTIAIYARFSSDLQDARSIEDQVARLRTTMERDGLSFSEDLVFTDSATSGSKWDRPGLQALLKAVANGAVRTIYVESIDRLSRDLGDAAKIRKRLEFHGCRLRSVGDGIDLDGRGSSSLAYDVKTIIAEIYLKDLADKTLRGLQGRARAGKSTGGRTYGYDVTPERDIVVNTEQADVVRRIFAMYASGLSCARIAETLNRDGIEPPRPGGRRRGHGWMGSGIREMLRNSRYVGDWSFGRRKWRKDPDTRRRLPTPREEADVIALPRPDLRVVDDPTWQLVQARHRDARSAYTQSSQALVRRPTQYLLSTLLVCDCCGGLMEIAGGAPGRMRYRCTANRKRGTCANRLSVRESVTREGILEGIREALVRPAAIDYVRQRLAERLGQEGREARREADERAQRLARTEERIRGLILMQADGDRSPEVRALRLDLEAQAEADRQAIASLRAAAASPARLTAPDELVRRVFELDAVFREDVVTGREALRRYLKGGTIRMVPQADGTYLARAELMPLVVMLGTEKETAPRREPRGRCPVMVAGAGFEPTTFGL